MSNRLFVLLAATVLVGGCAKDQQSSSTTAAQSDAERLRQEKIKFESENTPVNADTRFAAGQLAETEGDAPRAITQYQAALKLDPNHTGALFRLGSLYTMTRQFPSAVDIWHRYIKATNDSAAGYSNLGFCLEVSGHPPEAEKAYQAGIAKDGGYQPCRVNYGLMLARQGRLTDATAQLQAVLKPAEVHYNLASVLESQGKNDQAKVEYQKALDIEPNMLDAKERLTALPTN